jgi:hypothetical protein
VIIFIIYKFAGLSIGLHSKTIVFDLILIKIVIQVIWIISSTLSGIYLCISGTDEQVQRPRYT